MTPECTDHDLEHAERRFRIHPRTAWTAQRHPLGAAPQELLRDEDAVAVVRLPEGWPLVIQGPPAQVWKELAAEAGEGLTVRELVAPWTEDGGEHASVAESLAVLLEQWEALGLVTGHDTDA